MGQELTRPLSLLPNNPSDFIPLFNACVTTAATRTQEYLLFQDPEGIFTPGPDLLTRIFLMTYITRSANLRMTDSFNCTTMSRQQRILLGADWVWAILEKPTKNPRIQIAVQVLHLLETGGSRGDGGAVENYLLEESLQMACLVSGHRTMEERLVDFSASIGTDCYALFLFLGRRNDPGNVYGVLSNNFQAAVSRCAKIDRSFIENFFKGSLHLHTPAGMLQAIVGQRGGDPLTLLVKFT